MENNQNAIEMWLTIIGSIFAFVSLVIGVFAYRSISNYFRFRLDEKLSENLKERAEIIHGEISDGVVKQFNDSIEDKLDYWDRKFSELYKEARGK